MQQLTLPILKPLPSGVIVAVDVSAEDYLQNYTDGHSEWIEGTVIKMSPVTLEHDVLVIFLRKFLDAYLEIKSLGRTVGEPFAMRTESSLRQPDIQIILNDNLPNLQRTYMQGPADICIEVVSEESVSRDYGEKFAEYEKAGVREYWIIDPKHSRTTFYRLDQNGSYHNISLNEQNHYQTPLLPQFYLPVDILWQEELPGYFEIGDMVKAMLGNK